MSELSTQEQAAMARIDRQKLAAVPPRYYGASFDGYKTESVGQRTALKACKDFAEQFLDHTKTGTCLALIGDVGTGKTMLASAVINHLVTSVFVTERRYESGRWTDTRRRARPRYTTVMRMLRDIRDTYRKESALSEKLVMRNFIDADLLVLDEVGVQRGTEDEKVQLFEVLDGRYGELRPSIVISNLTTEELTSYIGDRVFDRLRENGGQAVVFDWQSQRGSA